ncbi:uncharacterized protein [Clytia hemisphaerica]|uniref:uncharacterized protein n=1 Tax=Clytia hemisphaerica TaxID=252671 RepID=UPI0034D5AC74
MFACSILFVTDLEKPGTSGQSSRKKPITVDSKPNKTLKYVKKIGNRMRKCNKRITEDFKYYYDRTEELMFDFERKIERPGGANEKTCDFHLEVFRPKYEHRKQPTETQGIVRKSCFTVTGSSIKAGKHVKAQTVMSRLFSLMTFLDFLTVRDIWIDLSSREIQPVKDKICELNKRTQKYVIARQVVYSKWKQENLLTNEDFIKIGSSPWAVKTAEILNDPQKAELNKNVACDCLNLLIFLICQGNATRSSNIVNMSLEHMDEAQTASEYESNNPAMILKSELYKTSIIYGDKLIVLPNDLFSQLTNYIKFIRPTIIKDDNLPQDKRPIFTSTRPKKKSKSDRSNDETYKDNYMVSSNVSKACTSTFVKSGMKGK